MDSSLMNQNLLFLGVAGGGGGGVGSGVGLGGSTRDQNDITDYPSSSSTFFNNNEGIMGTGDAGFLPGGLLDTYLKQQQDIPQQQQQQQQPKKEHQLNSISSSYNNNNTIDGTVFSRNGLFSMGAGGGTATTTITTAGTGGLGSYDCSNLARRGTFSTSFTTTTPTSNHQNEIDSLDIDIRLLQKLQQQQQHGMSFQQQTPPPPPPPQEKTNNINHNNWIGNMTGEGDAYAESGILGPWSARSAGLLGSMFADHEERDSEQIAKKKKNQNNKNNNVGDNKPKRPLSAYNIFFKEERNRILDSLPEIKEDDDHGQSQSQSQRKKRRKRKTKPHGKISFESLAKTIGQRWQDLTVEQGNHYKEKAEDDKLRYKQEMEWYYILHNGNGSGGGGLDNGNGDGDGSGVPTTTTTDTILSGDIPDMGKEKQTHHQQHQQNSMDLFQPMGHNNGFREQSNDNNNSFLHDTTGNHHLSEFSSFH